MVKQNTLPTSSHENQDNRHNPSQADVDRRFNEQMFYEIVSDPGLDHLRNNEQYAAKQPQSPSLGDGLPAAEEESGAQTNKNKFDGPSAGTNRTIPYSQGSKKIIKNRLSSSRRLAAALGLGGVGTAIVVAILLLLPLKLDGLISNALEAAERIPAYAAGERTEYLFTRVLATRMLQLTYGLDDSDIEPVFCKQRGAVGCSLLATYTSRYFSDTLGMDMIKLPNQTVRITINPKGRQALGGYARSWEIKLTRDWGESGVLNTMRKIETNKDMRLYLKKEVNKRTKNMITRFVARRVMMMKYGVRSWRAFDATREKIDNKVADVKTAFKVGMYKNTIGKISPRFAAYIACLQGGTTTCEDLLKTLSSNLDPPGDGPKAGETPEQYERRKKQYESLEKIGAKVRGEIPDIPTQNMLSSSMAKLFSTRVLAAVSGVFGAVMITDTVLKAVNGVNEGMLDTIGFDMASQVYTGFAFGDSTGVVTNWEKVKLGLFDGATGASVMSELGSLVDCDGSTLCAYENGYPSSITASILPVAGAATTGFARECSTDEGDKQVILAPGELVCPERKLYRNYAGLVVNNPWFQPLAQIAKVWEASIGKILNAVGTVVGWVTGPIVELLKPVTDAIGKQLEPLLAWFMDTVFNPPSVGYETTPANNYDALSGALHLEQWETMKNGVADGIVLGGGGMYINEEESQKIIAYQQSEEQESFDNQSTMARLFNADLKGSVAQQLVLQMPRTPTGLAKLPTRALASLFRLPAATAATVPATSSPFGLPNYSYPLGDSALTADPSTYTEESCAASAAAREASLTANVPGTTVPVYTKTDPCALEKLVVGSLITQANPTDPYAFQPIGGTQSTAPTDSGTCADNTKSLGVYDKAHDNGKQISVTLCEVTSIKLQPGFYTGEDPDIFRSGGGGLIVGASVSEQFQKLGEDALSNNRQLMGKGIRSYEKQEYFYACMKSKKCNNGNTAAEPGTSNHENGTAVDFVLGSGDLAWLRANGKTYDLRELSIEAWHWSP